MITKNDIENLIAENLKDSDWIAATLNTNVSAISAGGITYDKYRIKGRILYINMILKINEAISSNKILFSLPEGYRPNRTHTFNCSILNSATVRFVQITSAGNCTFFANGTSTGSGLQIYLDFNLPLD
jgi:hypothetical protein